MYEIKNVEEKDLSKLAEIMATVFTITDPDKPWDKEFAYKYLEYWFKKQPDMFLVSFDSEGNPVGAMAVNIKPWRTGVRCSDGVVFVDTKYQKQGIARALFKKVIGEAMGKYNAIDFEAVTFAGSEFPLSWYKQIGINPDEHVVLIKGKCADILANLG
ncbi:MAG: hypothetical protein A2571_03555 [Candidatus Vogelbacteria bacterium RIFOXYD1_FULL_44_32]|uniref:N-acetyltransferase domain-containing protein n=1 Tax=Candidatus Vogelbacteria bacterium RIFOXYD1_FULL_44_32 TaxID=1802438 RepID=A0A1G2QDC2_9BACT|nr:MAG: hypothetical protein A2571_03555 [Candidatus Vogelbacteria bacterium RIFOXYD1_FULL_44_32]